MVERDIEAILIENGLDLARRTGSIRRRRAWQRRFS
jgi:hypothetical protein